MDGDGPLFALLFSFAGVISYAFFYYVYKDSLNPYGIALIVWCLTAALGSIPLSSLESVWLPETYGVVILCALVIFTVGVCNMRYASYGIDNESYDEDAYLTPSKAYNILFFGATITCVLLSIYEFWKNGFKLFLFEDDLPDVKSSYQSLSSILHYGVIFLQYLGIMAVFDSLFIKRSKRIVAIDALIIIYVIFYYSVIYVSRGSLITTFSGILFVVSRKRRVKVGPLLLMTLVFLFCFYIIATYRITSMSAVFHLTKYGPAFNSIYSYISPNYNNLNSLISHGSDWTIISASAPLLRLSNNNETFMTAGFLNATTWLYPFYRDLGPLGVALYPTLCFLFVGFAYRKSGEDSRYIPLMSFFSKAVCVIFFGNYFQISFLNVLAVIFASLIIHYLAPENQPCIDSVSRGRSLREGRYAFGR